MDELRGLGAGLRQRVMALSEFEVRCRRALAALPEGSELASALTDAGNRAWGARAALLRRDHLGFARWFEEMTVACRKAAVEMPAALEPENAALVF